MADARLELSLRGEKKPLAQRARVRIHHGTSEVMARVVLLDRESLAAGRIGAGAVALRVAARRRRRRPVRRPLVFADVRDRRRQRRGPASAQAPEGRRRGGRGEARELAGRRGDPRRARPRRARAAWSSPRCGSTAAFRDDGAPVRAGRDEDGRRSPRTAAATSGSAPARSARCRRRSPRGWRACTRRSRCARSPRSTSLRRRGARAGVARVLPPGARRPARPRRSRRRRRARSAWPTHQPQWVGRFAAAARESLATVPRQRPLRAAPSPNWAALAGLSRAGLRAARSKRSPRPAS